MAKNFSVAWLSQSSQPDCGSGLEAALVHGPKSPTVQTKHASYIRSLRSDGNVKDVTKMPCSPTSKHSNSNTKVNDHLRIPENIPWVFFRVVINIIPSVSDSCGYTSGSESEVGDDSEVELGPNRRIRTKFTSCQIARLEKTFHKRKYLGTTQRRKIAEKLHLSETQVRPSYHKPLHSAIALLCSIRTYISATHLPVYTLIMRVQAAYLWLEGSIVILLFLKKSSCSQDRSHGLF